MKKLSYLLVGLIAFSTISCSDEDPNINVFPGETIITNPVLEALESSEFEVIKTKEDEGVEGNEGTAAGTFAWSEAIGEYNGSIQYFIQMAPEGTEFANAVKIFPTGVTDLSKAFTFGDLNDASNRLHNFLIANGANGLTFGADNVMEVRIMAVSQASQNTGFSNTITITINPYQVIIAEDPVLYLVGAPQSHYGLGAWDNTTAIPMRYIGTGGAQVFEAYVKIGADEEFKFIGKQGTWDNGNYGVIGGAQDGNLENSEGSGNIKVTGESGSGGEGLYYVWVDIDNLKYKAIKMDWGIIGSATAGDWSSETAMAYDFATNKYSISASLAAGEMKFRSANTGQYIYENDWKFNIGSGDQNFAYDLNAPNFIIEGGTYNLELTINFDGTAVVNGL